MSFRNIAFVVVTLATPAALADANLSTSVTAPAAAVYAMGTYGVSVANIGNQNADNVVVTIDLPQTATNPIALMATVGSHPGCTRSGARITCALGQIRKNKSASVSMTASFPWSAAPLALVVKARTSSAESNLANNDVTRLLNLTTTNPSLAGPRNALHRACSGTNLTSFYECAIFPSSLTSFVETFEANHTITVASEPDVTGTWERDGSKLLLEYTYGGLPFGSFEGYGVSATCFEGLLFDDSNPEPVPTSVCLQ